MDKKELQKAQNIIDVLFYDDKALTQWQNTLLENVISIAQTKLRQPLVISSVCTCTKFRETPMINGKNICSICNKPIVQIDL